MLASVWLRCGGVSTLLLVARKELESQQFRPSHNIGHLPMGETPQREARPSAQRPFDALPEPPSSRHCAVVKTASTCQLGAPQPAPPNRPE
eukprot:10544067-Alexandrium_andersonii.AAC.1